MGLEGPLCKKYLTVAMDTSAIGCLGFVCIYNPEGKQSSSDLKLGEKL